MKKYILIILLTVFCSFYFTQKPSASVKKLKQSKLINSIIKNESNISHKNNIIDIVNYIDYNYNDLYNKLRNGKNITIFFDPAHGKLKNGKWQGDVTWRQSTTGFPEEHYSIPLSRELYKRLSGNKYITVATTDDFMQVLKGKSNEYKNIYFPDTIRLAKMNNSFLIISSHLNNVSPLHKADGRMNIPGIHITCDKYGRQYLSDIRSQYKGYLTMYNKLDPTGFSYLCANNFKQHMTAKNLTANNWEHGAVAYDRFTYFSNFPFSIIFESGFISNPTEEEMLSDPYYQSIIAESQYKAIIDSLKFKFGIDISDGKIKLIKKQSQSMIDMLKMSRIILYYIRTQEVQKAINLSIDFENNFKNYRKTHKVSNYKPIKNDLIKIRNYLRKARYYKKKKKYWSSKKYYRKAISVSSKKPLYYPIRTTARREYYKLIKPTNKSKRSSGLKYLGHPPDFEPLPLKTEKHSYKTPFLLVVENPSDIESAIAKSIAPSDKFKTKINNSLLNPKIVKWKWKKYYSKKYKKYKWKKYKSVQKITYKKGIYIVRLNKNLSLKSIKRVRRVRFNPNAYQNELYFKNSYIASDDKPRKL